MVWPVHGFTVCPSAFMYVMSPLGYGYLPVVTGSMTRTPVTRGSKPFPPPPPLNWNPFPDSTGVGADAPSGTGIVSPFEPVMNEGPPPPPAAAVPASSVATQLRAIATYGLP